MASTTPIVTPIKAPDLVLPRVLQAESGHYIKQGWLVGINAAGRAIEVDTTKPIAGVAHEDINPGWYGVVDYNHVVYFSLPGVTQADIYSVAYAADNNTLTLTANTAVVGQIIDVDTTNEMAGVHITLSYTGLNLVRSVFGRTGDVVAQTGDYDHSQLTSIGSNTHAQIDTHIASTANPHSVTQDQVGILTTKGDLLSHNNSNHVRLPVGTNDYVLTAASGEASGLKWSIDNTVPTILQGSEEAEDTTTSTSFVQTYRFSPTLEVAKYAIWVSAEYTHTNKNRNVEGRVQIDDTINIVNTFYYTAEADYYCARGAVYFYDCLSAGTHDFDFDFRRVDTPGSAKIRRKRIIIMKVVE